MHARFTYAIKFVKSMDDAVAFHRDVLGLPLKFQSPEWSEFATEGVTLALHPASAKNPPGRVELGFATKDLKEVYADRGRLRIDFLSEPKPLHGVLLATIADSDGNSLSLSEE